MYDGGGWVKIAGKWGQESFAQALGLQARHHCALGVAQLLGWYRMTAGKCQERTFQLN